MPLTRSLLAKRTALAAVAFFAASMFMFIAGQGAAQAAGGAYSVKWTAADPAVNVGPYAPTYDKVPPSKLACPTPSDSIGRASDPLANAVFYTPPANTKADSVSSLAPKDMTLGQIVPFEMEVTVGDGANGDLRVNPYFLAKTTSGGDFGFDPSYGIYCAFVDTHDAITDPGNNARVASFTSSTVNAGTKDEQTAGTIDISGANPGDHFIVEIWVVLDSKIGPGITGNVQTGITSASEPSSGDKVNVGNQTIPLLKAGDFYTGEPKTPKITTEASEGGKLGKSVYDTAHLDGGGDNYAGTITFKLYDNGTCSGSPVASVTKAVNGGDGAYVSPPYTPTAAGTYYWVASFASSSAGVADAPATTCNDPAEKVVITPATTKPTLTTTASAGGPLGTSIHDTATLANGPAGNYHGTLTFKLYANDTCSGTPVTTLTKAVTTGNGSYDSPSYTPATAGTYYWVASFKAGTGEGDGQSGDSDPVACNDPAEKVVITPKPVDGNGQADLEIHKVATKAKASPGENVPYVFTVKNNGPDVAHNVTVKDAIPHDLLFVSADPRCDYSAGLLTCDLGTIQPGQTVSFQAVLQLAPTHTSSAPVNDHSWDIQKVEEFHSLQAGQSGSWSLNCPTGYVMTDAGLRTDSVDQNSGGIDAVHVTTSKSDPASDGRWLLAANNGTTGQAQMHAFGVCMSKTSTVADGHTHSLQVSNPVTSTDTFGIGRNTKTLACPAGSFAIAPGFAWNSGSYGEQYRSEATADGNTWTFGFDQAAPGTVQTSVRCLNERTTTDNGHFEILRLTHVDSMPIVPPADMNSSQPYGDYRVSCPSDAKGIVGTFDLPRGVKHLGNTPEPINRDFRLSNTTGSPQQVHLDLLCMGIRIGDFGNGGSVTNTAWVFGDEIDTNSSNDISSFVLEDPPGPPSATSVPRVGGSTATLTKRSVVVPMLCDGDASCSTPVSVTALVGKKKIALGTRTFAVGAGARTALGFRFSRAVKKQLASSKFRYVTVTVGTSAPAKIPVSR